MKKVLSLILAMAMVLSLAPQIFAVEEKPSTEPDITFLPGPAGSECSMKVEAYNSCTGVSEKANRIRFYFREGQWKAQYTSFAIRIKIPVNGKYALSVNAADVTDKTDTGYADVYMAKVAEDRTYTGEELVSFAKSFYKLGEYDGTGDAPVGLQNVEYNFEQGDYLIVFFSNQKNETLSAFANGIKNYIASITLTKIEEEGNVEEEITDTTVNFKASAYTGGSVSDATVQEVTIGTDVTVTATPNAGYTFAYWKNSAGVVISTNATETFKVNTNTAVIAVFDEDVAEGENIPVYFYNGNGTPLGNASVAKGTTFETAKTAAGVSTAPSLTGFVFSHWSDKDANIAIENNDLIEDLTRAVAIYKDDETKTFTVKNGTATVASGVKYGESVTVNGSDNFSCWKLGDKVVSYEKNYTFDVYGNITLTEVTGETMTKAPVLVLDKVGENCFLTYDAGNYELIEAGILFGSEGVSIGSIDGYKAAAKRYTGQFTAQPHESADENTIARGYMICKNGGTFKVIYAD